MTSNMNDKKDEFSCDFKYFFRIFHSRVTNQPTNQQTNQPTNQQTDRASYRFAVAHLKSETFFVADKQLKAALSIGPLVCWYVGHAWIEKSKNACFVGVDKRVTCPCLPIHDIVVISRLLSLLLLFDSVNSRPYSHTHGRQTDQQTKRLRTKKKSFFKCKKKMLKIMSKIQLSKIQEKRF